MTVDLHLHTNASDGSMSPRELVKKAVELNYKAIAITDHDTIKGIKPALKTASSYSLEVIPGIEINTEFKEHEVHILGYYIMYDNPELLKSLEYLKQKRIMRVKKILDRLSQMGIKINFKQVKKVSRRGTVGRAHIARVLLNNNYVDSWDEAFEKYIGIDAPAYVKRDKYGPQKSINLIKKAGGVPVLAHPGFINNDDIIDIIIDMGIEGLEVYYYEHSQKEINKYKKYAKNHNLIITGGSDDHGPKNKDGIRLGKIKLSYNIVKQLKNAVNSKNKEI
ncbi:MAG: PHP domain-containing protein [Bacillota bacterium]